MVPFLCGCGSRSEYPDRPITLICPWAAGGGTDRVSRQTAAFLERELGEPVNVVNATGGAGVAGHSRGLHAKPDGYTITMMTVEINMLHWRNLTEISWREATPLLSLNEDAAALFVRSDAPWKNLAELTEEVLERPGELTASGTATGGIWHLALAGWLTEAGASPIDIKWIPTNGAGPSLQELASGGIDIVSCSLPEARISLEGGLIRCLGVMSPERVAGFEDVPTLKEQGIDWSMTAWRGLAVPKGTPQPIVDKLVAALERIVSGAVELNGKTFPQFMANQGFNADWRRPARFTELLGTLDEKFGAILTSEQFASISQDRVGRMVFPGMLFALLGLLLVVAVTQQMTGSSGAVDALGETPTGAGFVSAILVVAAVVFYFFAAETIGFVLTTAAILLALTWWLGSRWWVAIVVAALLASLVYHLFDHLLRVPLPRGLLGW